MLFLKRTFFVFYKASSVVPNSHYSTNYFNSIELSLSDKENKMNSKSACTVPAIIDRWIKLTHIIILIINFYKCSFSSCPVCMNFANRINNALAAKSMEEVKEANNGSHFRSQLKRYEKQLLNELFVEF